MQPDWTTGDSLMLGAISLLLFAIMLLAYLRDKLHDWWRRRRR